MGKQQLWKTSDIKQTDRYREIAETNAWDTSDPFVDELIVQLCFSLDGMERMRREISEGGTLVDGLHGKKSNPALPALGSYQKQASTCIDQLKKRRDAKPTGEVDALDKWESEYE